MAPLTVVESTVDARAAPEKMRGALRREIESMACLLIKKITGQRTRMPMRTNGAQADGLARDSEWLRCPTPRRLVSAFDEVAGACTPPGGVCGGGHRRGRHLYSPHSEDPAQRENRKESQCK